MTSSISKRQTAKIVKVWLFIGVVMLLLQIFIGGVTRLTGSGLSITKWDIVTGTLPPLSEKSWEDAFDLYKATPQYAKINQNMTIKSFKYIYFWEYLHRLWARTMGLVFLIPFIFFMFKKMLSRHLLRRLGGVVALAGLAAVFGWIMVASGLINRPWVNAYKLSIHLSIGVAVFAYMLWTWMEEYFSEAKMVVVSDKVKKLGRILTVLISIQIFFGGIMSGMKAATYYPTWPDMNGEFIPQIILHMDNWSVDNLIAYDKTLFASGLIQFLHRSLAYIILMVSLYFIVLCKGYVVNNMFRNGLGMLIIVLSIQITLGITTLLNSTQTVPVTIAVLHQLFGVLLLGVSLYINFVQHGRNKV